MGKGGWLPLSLGSPTVLGNSPGMYVTGITAARDSEASAWLLSGPSEDQGAAEGMLCGCQSSVSAAEQQGTSHRRPGSGGGHADPCLWEWPVSIEAETCSLL